MTQADKTGSNLPSLQGLMERASAYGQNRAAPVERWNPPFCGEIDMEIRADGRWFYMGTPINRPALVRLFASVLRKDDDGRVYLVTPQEKVEIRVEDAPFLAVEMSRDGAGNDQRLTFRTALDDVVEAGAAHPLRFVIDDVTGGLKPYLLVRGRLEALVSRAVTYDLVDCAEEIERDGQIILAVRSNGMIFEMSALCNEES